MFVCLLQSQKSIPQCACCHAYVSTVSGTLPALTVSTGNMCVCLRECVCVNMYACMYGSKKHVYAWL